MEFAAIIVKPPAKIISKHKVKSKKQYAELLNEAIDAQCLLYYTNVTIIDGKPVPKLPWILDEKSIKDNGIVCEICGKRFSSKSGKTLHIKSRH